MGALIFHGSHHEQMLTTGNENQTMRHRDRKPGVEQEAAEVAEVGPQGNGEFQRRAPRMRVRTWAVGKGAEVVAIS
jgi:hypothetical protein